jgi:hypothetical protein
MNLVTVVMTVAPVFGLILIGYVAGRSGYVSQAASKGVPEFIFKVAMPVLLFRTIATSKLPDIPLLSIVGTFFGAAAGTWLLATIVTRFPLRRPATDAPALAMGATFSNSVMLGIPLCLAHFGPSAAPILAIIVATDTGLLWLSAILHHAMVESSRSRSVLHALADLAQRLLNNPIILGCIAGLAWQWAGLTLPTVPDRIIALLAQAAVPGALCALGLALASYGLKSETPAVLMVTVLKCFIMPALAWILMSQLIPLPPLAAGVILAVSAMPVGANAYLFAAAYDRAPAAVSGAIALSTLVSVFTLTLLLYWIGNPTP